MPAEAGSGLHQLRKSRQIPAMYLDHIHGKIQNDVKDRFLFFLTAVVMIWQEE